MTLWNELFTAINSHVRDYRTDIEMDKSSIALNEGVPFIHVARQSGTHLFYLRSAKWDGWPKAGERVPYIFGTATRWGCLSGEMDNLQAVLSTQTFSGEKICHVFYGHKLKKIKPEKALEILRNHNEKIGAEWLREEVK